MIWSKFFTSLSLAGLLVMLVGPIAAQDGAVKGFVYNEENSQPIPYANAILKGTSKGAVASEEGYFIINDVPPGDYNLRVTFLGFEPYEETIKVGKSQIASVKIYLKPKAEMLESVEVSAEQQARRTKVLTSVVQLDKRSIQRFSVGGDADVIKAVQVMPGVVTTGDQGGQLFIRGGAPIQNLVLLDGMVIYNPFHSIGFFSVFDSDIIEKANVYTGGFSAEYGSRNSAVMDIRTRVGNRERLAGKVSASTYTGKLLLEAPLGKPNKRGLSSTSFLLSAKTSYLDQASSIFYPYVDTEFDNGLPFSFTDVFAKVSSKSENGSGLNFFGFNFDDQVRFAGTNSIDWNTSGGGFNFTAIPSSSTVLLSGNANYSVYDVNAIEGDRIQNSRIAGFNGGLDFTYFFRKSDEMRLGIEAITYATDFSVQPPVGITAQEQQNTSELGAYVRYKFITDRLVLEPSFRFHYYSSQAELSLEPRLGLKYNISDQWRFKASGGLYSQNLMAGYNDQNVVNLFYGFLSGPTVGNLQQNFRGEEVTSALQKARHVVAGFEYDITKNLTVNLEGYIKDFNQMTNLNRNQIYEPNSPQAQGEPEILSRPFILERGLARGIDLLVKYRGKNLYLWMAYSLGKVTRDDGQQVYAPNFDRRHNLNLVGNYNFGKDKNWQASLRYNFGTGFPFTPNQLFYGQQDFLDNNQGSVDYDYTRENGNLDILPGELNSNRLPNYHRVDASISKDFPLTKVSSLKVTAGATNILDYQNVFYYDRSRSKRVDQLPIMPTVSVAYDF